MSDEQKKEEAEVEGHVHARDYHPRDASDEPTDEAENEVEAHTFKRDRAVKD